MITGPFVGLSLIVSVATGPLTDPATPSPDLSMQQKNAAVRQFVRSATDCVAQSVIADPRLADAGVDIGELIVDSMPACAPSMRAMVDAYDRCFGEGAGEAFLSGPYLDILPIAVSKRVKQLSEKN